MSFYVNQIVECINADPGFGSKQPVPLEHGAKYQISDAMTDDEGDFVKVSGSSQWYSARRFRPLVQDRKSVSFTIGTDLDSERWDNRKKIKERT